MDPIPGTNRGFRGLPAAFAVAWALAVLTSFSAVAAHSGEVENAIESHVGRLRANGRLALGSAEIASRVVLPEFYERRGFQPAWTEAALAGLTRAIETSASDGLDPADYHLRELSAPRGETEAERSDRDVIATDALIGLAYHLSFGRVDPNRLDADWNFTRHLRNLEPVGAIARAIESGEIERFVDDLRPRQPLYRELRVMLERYRAIGAAGGWPRVGPGPTLALGSRDPRVLALRRRLIVSGDHPPSSADTSLAIDPLLEQSLRAFQRRHRMDEDGRLGPGTVAALDVPVGERIDQIRVNLERGRWVLNELPDSFIVVNVAAFEVFYVVGGKPAWRARCQVGQAARKTPIFRSDLRYLVFNPTWTVPPGIIAKDILPSLKRGDLSVLQRKKLKVIDSKGRVVAPGSVAWSRYSARGLPYLLRQDAGPDNALGRVKFMFPNAHAVYLHDTPSKHLFEETSRAFSSGCIRVERPLELAERVLADTAWSAARIQRVVDGGETTNVPLANPLPVLLLYWTAFPLDDGRQVAFAPDIYGRDAGVLKGLAGPYRVLRDVADSIPPQASR